MNYEELIETIINKRRFGRASGYEVTREMTGRLGHPERGMRIVHIAGTNGKGSTAAFVSSILQAAGFCVGQFTSPHLVDFTERIQVNGEQIPRGDVVRLGERVLAVPMELECTMFDICLAIALLYFKERECDFVVLETGLGGRLDSTNGLGEIPQAAVITNIGLDHTQILGDTIEAIAAEKAGILKPGTTGVFGPMEPAARRVLEERCRELDIPWVRGERAETSEEKVSETGCCGRVTLTPEQEDAIGLPGVYQRENAATAAAAFSVLWEKDRELFLEKFRETTPMDRAFAAWKESVIARGLRQARWPGRMEILKTDPFFLIDGAHNPQGVHALAQSLQAAYPGEQFLFVVGILADKDYGSMLEEMLPLADRFYAVTVENSRSLQARQVAGFLRARGARAEAWASLGEALEQAFEEGRRTGRRVVAFGSLYFIGSIREEMSLWEK